MFARSSYARRIKRRVGYRSSPIASRSFTAARNLPSDIEPATHRLRRTATVSTSTRSGAARSLATRTSFRARRPSAPSSPTTLARMDASTTINFGTAPPQCPRRLVGVRRGPPGVVLCGRAPHPSLAARLSASAHRKGTVAATVHATPLGAVELCGRPRGCPGSARSACLHYAITTDGLQPSARAGGPGEPIR